MKNLALRFGKLILGLMLYAVGIVLTIRANIGYGPWEVFHIGLGATVGISIGTASILVGVAIILLTLSMGETIGAGTLLNIVLIGVFIDILLGLNLVPVMSSLVAGIPLLILGLYVIALGSFFYIGSGFGAGPRDGLMVALTRRTGLPIGVIRGGIELSATLAGWLLGGMVGVGTLISGFMIGFCIQSTFGILKFKPVTVRHSSLRETMRELASCVRA